MNKQELIQQAIADAGRGISGLPNSQFNVPALTSIKIRHLLSNLGSLGTAYLECGVHKGGTFTATVANSDNLKHIYAVDSFESDVRDDFPAQPIFLSNANAFVPTTSIFKMIVSDCFRVDLSDITVPIDLYLYDGGHSEKDQEMALTYYLPVLANEFIFICDDYDWIEVQKGTQEGIRKSNLEILFEKHLVSNKSREEGGHDNDSWWNGFYVALLKKK